MLNGELLILCVVRLEEILLLYKKKRVLGDEKLGKVRISLMHETGPLPAPRIILPTNVDSKSSSYSSLVTNFN
jgi:hypothetical protein